MRPDCIIPTIKEKAIELLFTTVLSHEKIGEVLNCSRGPIYNIYKQCKQNGMSRLNIKRQGFHKICKTCNKKFWTTKGRSARGRSNFCSKKCYTEWQKSKENRGRKNPNWKHGNSYKTRHRRSFKSKSWRIWRTKVYKRDNYTCVLCGKTNCVVIPHHILPRRCFPKLIYAVNNGATVCKKCHNKMFMKELNFVNIIVKKLFGSLKRWKLIKHYRKRKMQKVKRSGFRKQRGQ